MINKIKAELLQLATQYKVETCPTKQAEILGRAKLLVKAQQACQKSEAQKRVNYLKPLLSRVWIMYPDALDKIENRKGNYETFLPYLKELRRSAAIQKEIDMLCSKYRVEVTTVTGRKGKQATIGKGEGERIRKAKAYAARKFKKLERLNTIADTKEAGMELRTAHRKGKAALVNMETGFNGTRRNDQATNNRFSWNPTGKVMASAKGAR